MDAAGAIHAGGGVGRQLGPVRNDMAEMPVASGAAHFRAGAEPGAVLVLVNRAFGGGRVKNSASPCRNRIRFRSGTVHCRSPRNCSGVSFARHSASLSVIFLVSGMGVWCPVIWREASAGGAGRARRLKIPSPARRRAVFPGPGTRSDARDPGARRNLPRSGTTQRPGFRVPLRGPGKRGVPPTRNFLTTCRPAPGARGPGIWRECHRRGVVAEPGGQGHSRDAAARCKCALTLTRFSAAP